MRKLLLASAAVLGATGGLAHAQMTMQPSQGQMAAPWSSGPSANNNNNAWGTANTVSGSAAAGGTSAYGTLGANNNAVPAPGTVVIRLNGRVEADAVAAFTSADKSTNVAGAYTGYKVNPVQIDSYMRLYPGFDGLSAQGIRYGAAIELRENFLGASPANAGATAAAPAVQSPSATSSGQTVMVRRAFTYLAADKVGLIRLGQTDGVVGLYDNCLFTTQCWDAGVGVQQQGAWGTTPTNATGGGAVYPWLSQAGAEYVNQKVVYLTPQFFGFDLGVQYAPGQGNGLQNSTGSNANGLAPCAQPNDNCSSVTTGGTSNRWINQYGIGVRYEGTFGAVDAKAYGYWEGSGKENVDVNGYTAAVPGTAAFRAGATANNVHYQNLGFYQAGAALSAFGTTAAVSYIGGKVNGQLALDPVGGVNTNAWIAGLTYNNGPWTAGANFGLIDTQGAVQLTGTSQRHQVIGAFGGNYKVAPGVNLVLEYDYITQHQGDFNFNAGAVGNTVDSHAQGVLFSTVLTW